MSLTPRWRDAFLALGVGLVCAFVAGIASWWIMKGAGVDFGSGAPRVTRWARGPMDMVVLIGFIVGALGFFATRRHLRRRA